MKKITRLPVALSATIGLLGLAVGHLDPPTRDWPNTSLPAKETQGETR